MAINSLSRMCLYQSLKQEKFLSVLITGCCHTDVHAIDGDWPVSSKLPLIPGHEGVGEIVAIGPNVTTRKLGDRVGIAWLHCACGVCC
jgi:propanol-preferring alcohol dehydrogenase